MFEQILIRFCRRRAFCDIRPIRNHQLIGLRPITSRLKSRIEVRVVFMYFSSEPFWCGRSSIQGVLIAKIAFS